MKIVYTVPEGLGNHLEKKIKDAGHEPILVTNASAFSKFSNIDLFIDGRFNGTIQLVHAPLLINSTTKSLNEFNHENQLVGRFCGWPGFWEQSTWEIAASNDDFFHFKNLLSAVGISAIIAPDITGMIAPRILCTIINEAAHTLAAGVANKNDIDTAMKLGTNYPKGPIEWGQQIGLHHIEELLQTMAQEDAKYEPHPALLTIGG